MTSDVFEFVITICKLLCALIVVLIITTPGVDYGRHSGRRYCRTDFDYDGTSYLRNDKQQLAHVNREEKKFLLEQASK